MDKRFEFGENWSRFLCVLNLERIEQAKNSLRGMLGMDNLKNQRFLDIGSGSGLFSLAARSLGASVVSFDYDPQSAACTAELKRRYFLEDKQWIITQNSVLDEKFIHALGKFDIVYSWGVLHHTGNLAQAMTNAAIPLKKGGRLFIALYNDQGVRSKLWTKIKKLYCSGLPGAKIFIISVFVPIFTAAAFICHIKNPLKWYKEYQKNRGMSVWHDWVDWLGGYPFETASPKAVLDFYKAKGFQCVQMKTTTGLGNNEFVFKLV